MKNITIETLQTNLNLQKLVLEMVNEIADNWNTSPRKNEATCSPYWVVREFFDDHSYFDTGVFFSRKDAFDYFLQNKHNLNSRTIVQGRSSKGKTFKAINNFFENLSDAERINKNATNS